jgi:hypothetical protein
MIDWALAFLLALATIGLMLLCVKLWRTRP